MNSRRTIGFEPPPGTERTRGGIRRRATRGQIPLTTWCRRASCRVTGTYFARLQNGKAAQTSGEDSLKTVRLVFAAYESAARNQVVYSSMLPETRAELAAFYAEPNRRLEKRLGRSMGWQGA